MIYGLDLSLTATGISDGTAAWLITSTGKSGASLSERDDRLWTLRNRILDALTPATLVVVEAPAFSRQNGHMHDRSGLWWLVVTALHARDCQVVEVPPTCLKRYATGKGNANKGLMIEAATRRFPHVDTAGDDNRVDALWLAAMGHDHLGTPLVALPAAHRASLEAVRWAA